ncbi:antibiotic biosynthesis monooxygenase family protein [Sphingobium sp. CCH11-B1]|uniref:antibiotic biosynthesis monooxygenase family protein n=1 Tax=Sphingobium sp. CCH11-B1 TaxID=1768781 RepID=UPI0018D27061|nr:hypothetical protein [Sphingobium sp. CCH11-B1]
MRRIGVIAVAALGAFMASSCTKEPQSHVIEVVTLKIRPGVSVSEFTDIDKAVEQEHVSRQPGFISRESAPGRDRDWLVIVHWRSVKDADASMNSFASAPSAQKFMGSIEPDTMVMKRYGR